MILLDETIGELENKILEQIKAEDGILKAKLMEKNSMGEYLLNNILEKLIDKNKIHCLDDACYFLEMPSEENNNPERYFSHDRRQGVFIPEVLADDIMLLYDFLTLKDTDEVFWFDTTEGLWKLNGEVLIKRIGTELLGEKTKQNYLSETIGFIKAKTYEDRNKFDNPHLDLLPVKNGILNLQTLEMLPYTKDYYFTSKLNVEFDSKAECPQIKKFLEEIVEPEDVNLLTEIAGYCLYRKYPIQKAFMLVGDGANAKSTYLSLLCYFLGVDNVCAVSLQELERNRFASSNLYRKMANVFADLPKIALRNAGVFKMLTGGDKIYGEKKFKNAFFFDNYAKLIFSANRVPFVEDESSAFFRRWVIINFPNKFEGSNVKINILQELTEELSGFLNLALMGLKKVLTSGLSYYKTTEEIRNNYIRASDPIAAFILDCITISPEGFVDKDKLYNSYSSYCRIKKLLIVDKNVFSKNFRKYVQVEDFRPTIEGKRVQCWKGISIVNPVKDVNDNSYLNSKQYANENKIENSVDRSDTSDALNHDDDPFKDVKEVYGRY